MSKKISAEEWLDTLKPAANDKPDFIGSITTIPLRTGGKVVVWRGKDEVWGNFEGEDLVDYQKKIGNIDHSYGREIVEALIKVTRVVRIELYNAAGCGVIVLWKREAW